MSPSITLIAAVASNGVIGADNRLPWRIRSDLRHFRRSTLGKPLIVGRKTYQSTGLLPDRHNIVVTRDPTFLAEGAEVAPSLEAALDLAIAWCAANECDEIVIGGGGVIYRQAMDRADRLVITHVDVDVDGDTRFPDIDPAIWYQIDEMPLPHTGGDTANGRVVVYLRR